MRSHALFPLTNSAFSPGLLEEILYDLPPLEGVLLHWHTHGARALTPGIISLLSRREHCLGPATLPGASLQFLAACLEECLPHAPQDDLTSAWESRPLHARLVRHRASQSAVETQALLPPGVLVQKTVTLALGAVLVLCTGVGTQRLSHQERHAITAALGLPRRVSRRSTINPITSDAVACFGMAPGMVSPFLRPDADRQPSRLTALVLLPWPRRWEAQAREVAISLSLWESLLLPLGCLRPLLWSYASRAYPAVRVIDLSDKEDAGESVGDLDGCSPSLLAPVVTPAARLIKSGQRGATP
jgi:hypothetical protein